MICELERGALPSQLCVLLTITSLLEAFWPQSHLEHSKQNTVIKAGITECSCQAPDLPQSYRALLCPLDCSHPKS